MWRLYGWYSGLMLFGSCVGVVTWLAWMQYMALDFTSMRDGNLTRSQKASMYSHAMRWMVAFRVAYTIEFLCLTVAKLIVLDRMSDFVEGGWKSRRWAVSRWIVVACVIAGNVTGLACNIAAAARYRRVADLIAAASADYAVGNLASAIQNENEGREELERANVISSVQQFCEVAVLLLIVLSFAVVGAACARLIRSVLAGLNAADQAVAVGQQLRRQIVGVSAMVFVTFIIRSVYSTLYAVAYKLQDISKISIYSNGCDSSCANAYTQIALWMLYTPELQMIVVLASKPLPLLVALWGMTTGRLRDSSQTKQHEMVALR